MPTPKTPIDLSEYVPDAATADAMAEEPAKYNKNVDPALRARLEELKQRGSSPSLPRIAPPSVTAYVPPTEIRAASNAQPKVEIAVPPAPSEYPTQPSLRRLAGEPDVPGVVKGARGRPRPVAARTAVLAVLAVLAPVVLVILVMGRGVQKPEPERAAAAAATATASAEPAVTAEPSATATTTTAATAEPTASVTATATAPATTSATPRPKPQRQTDDPYDAATPTPALGTTAVPEVTATPSATAPTVKSGAPPYVEERPEF